MKMNTGRRAARMSDQIMQEMNRILVEDISDPRLELLSFSGVRLNRDFSIAEVLYTHLHGRDNQKEIENSLERAAGFFRKHLGQRLRLRAVPELRFAWDSFLEEIVYEAHTD